MRGYEAGMEAPWHMVLLVQPGGVPAGGVVDGWSVELRPASWQTKQAAALPGLVTACDRLGRVDQASGCGLPLVWQT